MKKYKLGDLLFEFHAGKAIQTENIKNKGAYPVYGGNGQRGYTDSYNQNGEYLIIGRQGAYCGNVRYNIGKAYLTEHAIVGQAKENHNPIYIALKLSLMNLSQLQGQSAQPGLSVNTLSCISMEMPPKEIQDKIADIMLKLDRKIELNRQINDNLEAQLRLITSRYIFSCPNLEKKRIGEIATVKAGGDCPITFSKTRTQKCNIPIFSNGTEDRGLYGFTNKANIEGHSITVAARGTIGYCERRLMPFVPIIRLLAITPKEDGAYIYLHQVIRGMKFKKNGSVQQQLTVPEISFIEIPYPHSSVLHEYNKVASPIVEMIERNISENEILTKQRDELLPLLMNGQASVNYHLSDD